MPITPADIAGVEQWLRADGQTVKAADGQLLMWADQRIPRWRVALATWLYHRSVLWRWSGTERALSRLIHGPVTPPWALDRARRVVPGVARFDGINDSLHG